MSAGRLLHTGQAIIDMVMRIEAVPEPGSDTFATSHELHTGGGFNVMAAAARDGADVVYAGGHGSGPFGDQVRAAMQEAGVQILSNPHIDQDTGFSIALVDDTAERTFISRLGAEGDITADDYKATHPKAGDIVYVTGYSLLHDSSRSALLTWLPDLPEGTRLVVDPSPVIGQVPTDVVRTIAGMAEVWSTNEREASLVAEKLGINFEYDLSEKAHSLAAGLGCTVVLRAGAEGAIIASGDQDHDSRGPVEHIAAHPVQAVDTNGAGDAHCGVLCGQLAQGYGVPEAVRRANISAALAITRHGPATAPTREELDSATR
ncbi:PfkB family carbohydrate kinase [Arthrobacter castelli]|uniref:PfkB family carbohydrate kinase n=1 Tax=Arthrobacter castelli TaxID=271431 RepID=UPI00041BB36C|nr:PfkB family carbohydrate kinase [Arthrobacter castelli]